MELWNTQYMRHATFVKHATNWQQLSLRTCKSRKHCSLCQALPSHPLGLTAELNSLSPKQVNVLVFLMSIFKWRSSITCCCSGSGIQFVCTDSTQRSPGLWLVSVQKKANVIKYFLKCFTQLLILTSSFSFPLELFLEDLYCKTHMIITLKWKYGFHLN